MNPEPQYIWTDKDNVVDYTQPMKKLWDNLMLSSFPKIKSFTTLGAMWVEHKKTLGIKYHMWEEDLKFSVEIVFNGDYLKELGWDGISKVDPELFYKVYGKEIFTEIRQRMIEIAKYAGIKISQFDLEGDFKVFID